MKTINEIQDEIVADFSLFEDDMESKLFYLMDLGKKLEPMDSAHQTPEFLIKGCMSKVWVYPIFVDGILHFEVDSNTEITKGLVALLVKIWNNRTPSEILNTDLYFIAQIGMGNMIGSQRSNGFAGMIQQMKLYATAFQSHN